MKRLIVSLFISLMLINASGTSSMAQEVETCIQVTQYGGGVGIVCGAKHEPVDAGLADINPLVLGFISLAFSGLLYLYSIKKDLKIREVKII